MLIQGLFVLVFLILSKFLSVDCGRLYFLASPLLDFLAWFKTLFLQVLNTVGFVCLAKPADADVMHGGLITFAKIAPSGKNPDHIMAVG